MLVFYGQEMNWFGYRDRRKDCAVWRSEYNAYQSIWAVPGTLTD